MQRLSGLDAAFVYLETPTNHMHVGLVGVFDPSTTPGGYSFAKVRARVESRLSLVPPFRRRLREVPFRLPHPVWIEDPAFDLDYHLRRRALPAPGGDGELAEFAADVFGRGLDRHRPLWEMYVVEGLQGGMFAVVTKIHHAAVDGVSGAEVVARLLDLQAEPVELPAAEETWRPEAIPTDLELLAQAGLDLMARIGPTLQAVRRAIEVVEQRRIDRPDEPARLLPAAGLRWAPKTDFNTAITPHRRFASAEVSLEDVRTIKARSGATVNDVALALSAGALRRYLSAKGTLPETPLVALVPVSVRAEQDASALGNKVSAMLISLPTDVGDPRQRLAGVAEATDAAKADDGAIDVETLTNWAEQLSSGPAARAARVLTSTSVVERFGAVFNVVVSNVRGSDIPLYLAGSKLVRLWPMGPVADGVALNITVMSYLGRLRFGLVACRETVPDLDELAGFIEAEVGQLLAAAAPPRRRPPAGRASTMAPARAGRRRPVDRDC
jgi:diacylglycerol O-acyltransferase